MIFTRTLQGLTNQHLFHRVDVVVFVEGGTKSLTYDDVAMGLACPFSSDIQYWQTVFKHFAPNTKVCFKPVGGKPTLVKIARHISQGVVKNTFVAMDQDFDRFKNSTINCNGVFYTWGYSFENDISHEVVLKEATLTICPIDRTTHEQQISSEISKEYGQALNAIQGFVEADVTLATMTAKEKGLFDRNGWTKYVKTKRGEHEKPYMNLAGLESARSQTPNTKLTVAIDARRDCFGHLICTYSYKLFSHLLLKYNVPSSMSLKVACALFSKVLGDCFTDNSLAEVVLHHESQFAFIST